MIEHRQLESDAERPFVIALVELIARVQVEVGILPGDLQAKLGVGCGVIGQCGENVRSAAQRDLARFGRGNRVGWMPVKIKDQLRAPIDDSLRHSAVEIQHTPPDVILRGLFHLTAELGGAAGYPQVVKPNGQALPIAGGGGGSKLRRSTFRAADR